MAGGTGYEAGALPTDKGGLGDGREATSGVGRVTPHQKQERIRARQARGRTVAMTGDGDMLMSLGALATVAQVRPRNFAIIVLDNECFGETGGQPTHTAGVADLAAIARGAGIEDTGEIREQGEIDALIADVYDAPGQVFRTVKIG